MKLNITEELKVTLTILLSLLIAFLGFRMMSDLPVFRQSTVLYSHFQQVDGLSSGNYVYINGVKVGSVRNIELIEQDSVRVTMNFDLGVHIPRGSVAYLESSGLLDEKVIVIQRSDSSDYIPFGGRIRGVYRGGMMETLANEGAELSDDVSESFNRLNQLLERMNEAMNTENRERLSESLGHVERTMREISGMIENKRSTLEDGIDHANRVMANLDTLTTGNREQVDSLLAKMNRSVGELETLSKDLEDTNRELEEILAKINRGEGSLGKMVNDPSLYNNLDSLSVEMKTLFRNINSDPGRYLKHMRLIEVF